MYYVNRNLADHLVHANFAHKNRHHRFRHFSALSPILITAVVTVHRVRVTHFSHPHTGKQFPIKNVITCSSTHVVYLLRCPCGLSYIGKTTRKLKQCISEHKSAIHRNDRNYPVAIHFNDTKHDLFLTILWYREG